MKPSLLLCAKSSTEGVFVIEGQGSSYKIRIVGSSVAKFIPNEEYSNSVTLSIKKGDKGLVAVNVFTPSGKNMETFVFFLKIEWGEDCERPIIDLDSQWVSKSPERLGVITHYGIKTEINGVIFSSNKHYKLYDEIHNVRYVSDHNLLCKYLAGDIEADVVKKAAAERTDEENARLKLPELEKKIQELTTRVAEAEKFLAKTEELLSKKGREATESQRQGLEFYKMWSAASIVIREAEKQWFSRPSLKRAIRTYKAVVASSG